MTSIREQFYKRRIAELSKDSSNSSKPPSSDTVRPPNPKQSGASRRHGGQPGHKGNNNIRWLKHLIFHSTAIILLSLCTGRIAIAQDSRVYVTPSSGDTGTDFYWDVHYYDADGDPPETKNVYIDGTICTMSLYSGSESNGTYKYGPKKLSAGNHDYYFYFTDGQGGSDRLPSNGTFSGPLVSESEVKPTVSIVAVDSDAGELPSGDVSYLNDGVFRVTRTGSTTSQLDVYYNVSGSATLHTDYVRSPEPEDGTFVTIPRGASYADISVRPVDDSIVEGAESIIFTLESDAAYTVGSPSSATVNISDNDLMCDFCGVNFGPPDGYVDVWDMIQFNEHWHTRKGGPNWDPKFDLTGPNGLLDGYVDVWDLLVFSQHWHEGVKP